MIYLYVSLGMITAKTRLIEAATALQRTTYRALPWGLRLGAVLFHLRFAADARSFGQLSYGLFHIYAVNGLPRTPFVPETLREIDRLPDGYGAEFGQKARRIAQKYVSDADQVDEILSLAALKLMSSSTFERSVRGKNLHEAENYVLRLVQNQALDMLRSEKVRRHEEVSEVIEDPKSWQTLGELIPPREIDRLRGELERVVSPTLLPDLTLYFDLLLDGYSNKQIAEDRMLPSLKAKPMTQQGLAKYRDKIKDVLRGHYNVQASACC